ncbi:MAG TPA: succinate--CoA ligase subunit alpha [Conexivisphaerales archaeon]|nr:succinate--CoA ligase subunit alpha [Conexivisphaerales archaeon]
MSLLGGWLSGSVEPRLSKVVVRGITGRYGSLHSQLMAEYGTRIVGGVTPGKGGQTVNGVPVFGTMEEAVKQTGAEVSMIFVPAPAYLAAVSDDFKAGIRLVVGITEKVPVRDTMRTIEEARRAGGHIIGPNTPGLILPGRIKLGIMPAQPFVPGPVALFSRSGTLTYEIADYIRRSGFGVFAALGIGGDPIISTNFIECLEMVRENPAVQAVAINGEIGGDAEEKAAAYIADTDFPKPVVAYIAGRSAPKEKKMGHAGAIIYGKAGTVQSKEKALNAAGVPVAKMPWEVPELLRQVLRK